MLLHLTKYGTGTAVSLHLAPWVPSKSSTTITGPNCCCSETRPWIPGWLLLVFAKAKLSLLCILPHWSQHVTLMSHHQGHVVVPFLPLGTELGLDPPLPGCAFTALYPWAQAATPSCHLRTCATAASASSHPKATPVTAVSPGDTEPGCLRDIHMPTPLTPVSL